MALPRGSSFVSQSSEAVRKVIISRFKIKSGCYPSVRQSAINGYRGPGDKPAFIRCEKQCKLGDFIIAGISFQGNHLFKPLFTSSARPVITAVLFLNFIVTSLIFSFQKLRKKCDWNMNAVKTRLLRQFTLLLVRISQGDLKTLCILLIYIYIYETLFLCYKKFPGEVSGLKLSWCCYI